MAKLKCKRTVWMMLEPETREELRQRFEIEFSDELRGV